ncbi:Astacin-like metalloendopeptidase [Strongyloides ratti]|uniref:Metalloendopeptidase n=1 Tax=Strongyloides ratti TaxID=34506 RepID=A0A090KYB3_STRRB|nr:Astacin-like metalloendopeptidase [Strongyloides ratti]CEF60867.1 Astacin-like metalloendopeptidase [Strongyloides ratti]
MNLLNLTAIFLITLIFLINKINPKPETHIIKKRSGISNDAEKLPPQIHWCLELEPGKTYNQFLDVSKIFIRQAMKSLQDKTCLTFTEETNCPSDSNLSNRLIKFKGDLKNRLTSYNFQYQNPISNPYEIKIEYFCNKRVGCFTKKILAYLGLILTHRRSDRDTYIKMNDSSISPNYKSEFEIINNADLGGTGYDYGSVMHISKFYRNLNFGDVFNISPEEYELMTGQEYGPSFNDLKLLNHRYCDDKCSTKLECKNGGYTNPDSCSYCECPNGYKGTLCAEIDDSDPGCGATELVATPEENELNFDGKKKCNIQITASVGKKIKINVKLAQVPSFNPCFEKQALEIKHRSDKSLTGLCLCTYAKDSIVKSEDNTVLIQYNGERVANTVKLTYQEVDE